MSTPYVGEIRMFGFPRIPNGWFACNGALVSIAEYEVLFVLLGTTYGGDGINTFGLPDLRGRAPVHQGQGPGLTSHSIGNRGGAETVSLNTANIPQHLHPVMATTASATTDTPGPTVVHAAHATDTAYMSGSANLPLAANTLTGGGNGFAHDNMMPSLAVSYCIAWAGIFPSQN